MSWFRDHVVDWHACAWDDDCPYRRCLMIRRPDRGWWFLYLDGERPFTLSLRQWAWLP